MDIVLSVLVTFLFVFFNGFFVAAEFAIVKVRSSQLELKAQAGSRVATLSKHIVTHLDAYLAATQFGITISSLALGGWIGEPVVSKLIIGFFDLIGVSFESFTILGLTITIKAISIAIAFLLITTLHIVLGELAPKSLAIQRSEQTTLAIAYPLHAFYWICRPFIFVLNGVANFVIKSAGLHVVSEQEVYTSDELRYLVDQAKESGKVDETEFDIIQNAFDFSERTARQVMVPRTQVVAIDANDYDEKTLEFVIEEGYSRIPCYEDSIDNVIGGCPFKRHTEKDAYQRYCGYPFHCTPCFLYTRNKTHRSVIKRISGEAPANSSCTERIWRSRRCYHNGRHPRRTCR